jgi:hypothetical protein
MNLLKNTFKDKLPDEITILINSYFIKCVICKITMINNNNICLKCQKNWDELVNPLSESLYGS